MFEDHLHNTGGNDWHVQLQANNTGTRLSTIVLYAETCSEAGGLATRVPIRPDGSFSVTDAKLEDGKGTWSVQGTFTDPDHATGTWSVSRGRCVITDHPSPPTTAWATTSSATQVATPRRASTALGAARRLRLLARQTRANARRWNTVAKAQRLGYVPTRRRGHLPRHRPLPQARHAHVGQGPRPGPAPGARLLVRRRAGASA